jgi:DNA repair protein RecO (recombination protein O)
LPITAKTYTTEAICLRAYDFGEADRILHLYSPEYGRISAIVKGAKKAKSKLAGACELLNISEIQLSKGKNLDLLCQYQPRETFIGLRSDLFKLAYGLLFAELVNLVATDTDSLQIYTDLKQALTLLDNANEAEVAPIGLEFQLAMLHGAGFQPVLNECIFTGTALDPEAVYYCFSAQLGGVTTPPQKRKHLMETGGQAEQWVNISTTTLRVLNNPHHPEWRMDALYKAQKFLQYYFKQVFEKPLHTYDLIFQLMETATPQSGSESREASTSVEA